MSIRGLNNESPKRDLPKLRRGRRIGKKKAPYQLSMDPLEKRELFAANVQVAFTQPTGPVNAGGVVTFDFAISVASILAYTAPLGNPLSLTDTFQQAGSATFDVALATVVGSTPDVTFALNPGSSNTQIQFDETHGIFQQGDTATFEVVATVSSTAPDGSSLTNAVSSFALLPPPFDQGDGSNSSRINNTDLQLTTQASPGQYVPGTNLTYMVTLANIGSLDAASSITFTETVDSSAVQPTILVDQDGSTTLSLQSFAANVFTFTAPSFHAGDQVTFTVTESLPAALSLTEPTLTDNFAVAIDPAAPLDSTSTTAGSAVFDANPETTLGVVKTTQTGDVTLTGSAITAVYTISVTNYGPSEEGNTVTLTDLLDTGETYISGSANAPWIETDLAGNSIEFTLSAGTSIDPSASAPDLTYAVRITASGTLNNTVTVNSLFDQTTSTDSASIDVVTPTDLEITKTGPSNAVAGTDITYDITVTNNGPSTETGTITVTDSFDSNATFTGTFLATDGWSTIGPVVGNVDNFTLAASSLTAGGLTLGGSTTFEVVASVNAALNTSVVVGITNSAAVTSANDTTNATTFASATTSADSTLAITKVGPGTALAGSFATYTITVTNTGPSDAQGVSVTDLIDQANTGDVSIQSATIVTGAGWTAATLSPSLVSFSLSSADPLPTATVPVAVFDVVVSIPPSATVDSSSGKVTITDVASVTAASSLDVASTLSATANLAVSQEADLVVSKTLLSAGTTSAGRLVTYEITVQNDGPSNAVNVTITDTLDTNGPNRATFSSTLASSGFASGYTATGTTIAQFADTNGYTLNSGASVTFDFVASIGSNATVDLATNLGTLTDVAVATEMTSFASASIGNFSSTASVLYNQETDLQITKTGPGNAVAGTGITYDITVTNNGPSIETGTITVTDSFDSNATFTGTFLATDGWSTIGPVVGNVDNFTLAASSLTAGGLTLGGSTTFEVVASVNAALNTSVVVGITNSAAVTSANDTTNATTFASATTSADSTLAITKVGPGTALAGSFATYTITVTNTGPSDAQGVSVTDLIDQANTGDVSIQSATIVTGAGWTAATLSPSLVSFSLSSADPLPTATVPVAVFDVVVSIPPSATVDSSSGKVTITDVASVTAASSLDVASTLSATANLAVSQEADLVVSKTLLSAGTTSAGRLVTYEITVQNDGPSNAVNVTITDTLDTNGPNRATFSSTLASSGFASGYTATGTTIAQFADTNGYTLNSGASVTFDFVASIASNATVASTTNLGTLTDVATATEMTSFASASIGNFSSTASVLYNQDADLTISKAASTTSIVSGGAPVYYTIAVTNLGPSDAQNVTVSDRLNLNNIAQIQVASESAPGGWTALPVNGTTLSFSTGTLAGNSATATFVVGVTAASGVVAGLTLADAASVATTTTLDGASHPTSTTIDVLTDTTPTLALAKTAPGTVVAGSPFDYTFVVTNHGVSAEQQTVTITDQLANSLSFLGSPTLLGGTGSVSLSSSGGQSLLILTGESIGALGGETSISILASLNPSTTLATLTVTNQATVNSADNNGPTFASVTSDIISETTLTITKVGPTATYAGVVIDYTIVVTNSGPSTEFNTVTVTDLFDQNTTFASLLTSSWNAISLGPNEEQFTTLNAAGFAPGQSVTLEVAATIQPNVFGGHTITNTVTVSSADDQLPFGTATAPTAIIPADLAITISPSSATVTAGTTFVYDVQITNNGPVDGVPTVSVIETLDANTKFVNVLSSGWTLESSVGSVFTFEGPSLAATSLSVLAIEVSAVPFAASLSSTLSTQGTVFSALFDQDLTNNTNSTFVNVVAQTDLALTKQGPPSAFASNAFLGTTTVAYTFTVTNNGPSGEQGTISITDQFDVPSVNFLSVGSTLLGSAVATTITPIALGGGEYVFTITGESIAPMGGAVSLVVLTTLATSIPGNTVLPNNATVSGSDDTTTSIASWNVTVTPVADLAITKTGPTTAVHAGDEFTYTLEVTNNGPVDAAVDVTITDTLDGKAVVGPALSPQNFPGITFTEVVSSTTLVSFDGVGSITAGQSVAVLLVASIPATTNTVGLAFDTVGVVAFTRDLTLGNNTATTSSPFDVLTNLAVTKTGPTTTIHAGNEATYTFTVVNTGPSNAQSVTVTDFLDPGNTGQVSYVAGSATFSPGAATFSIVPNGTTISFDLNSGSALLGNSQETVTFTVVESFAPSAVDSLTSNTGTLADTVTATNVTLGVVSPTVAASYTTTIDHLADLTVQKTGPTTTIHAGNEISYTITVQNQGPSDSVGAITLTDLLDTLLVGRVTPTSSTTPAGVWVGSVNGSTLAFVDSAITLAPGAANTLTFDVVVSLSSGATVDNAHGGTATLTDVATVAQTTPSDSLASTTSSWTVTYDQQANLLVQKTGPTTTIHAGDLATYTVTVQDLGPSDAQNVVVTDVLIDAAHSSSEVSFVTASPAANFSLTSNGTTITFTGDPTLALLGRGPGVTFTVVTSIASTATVGSTGTDTLVDTASATLSTSFSPAASTLSANYTTTIDTFAELTVSQTLLTSSLVSQTPGIAVAGTDATFVITVANFGPSVARTVALTEVLPSILGGGAFLTLASARAPAEWTPSPAGNASVSFSLASTQVLDNGASATFTVVESISPSLNDFGPSPVNATLPSTNVTFSLPGSGVTGIATSLPYTASVRTSTPTASTSSSLSAPINITVSSVADLALNLSVTSNDTRDPSTVFLQTSSTINVALSLTNLGPSDARNLIIVISPPATPGPLTWAANAPTQFGSTVPPLNGVNSTFLVVNPPNAGSLFTGLTIAPAAHSVTLPTTLADHKTDSLSFQLQIGATNFNISSLTVSAFLSPIPVSYQGLTLDSAIGQFPKSASGTVNINPGTEPIFVVQSIVVLTPIVIVVTAVTPPPILVVASKAPEPATISTPLVLQQLSRSNQTGEIIGWVFNDSNANGIWDDEERPEEGVTVYLDTDNSGIFDESKPHTVTNSQGEFRFPNLTAGTYSVRVLLGNQDQQTYPDPMKGNAGHEVVVAGAVTFSGRTKEIKFGIRRRARKPSVVPEARAPETPTVVPVSQQRPTLNPPVGDGPPPGFGFHEVSHEDELGRAAVFQRFDELIPANGRGAWAGLEPGEGSGDEIVAPNQAAGAVHAEPGDGWLTRMALAGMLAGALVMIDDGRTKPDRPPAVRDAAAEGST